MATARQKKLAQLIVENSQKDKPGNKQDLLVSAGYSVITAESSSSVIIEQKGVQEELSALGFTESNAKAVVAKILLDEGAENKDRLKASELVFKVHGSFQPEDTNDNPRIVNIFQNPTFQVATRAYEDSLKKIITHEPVQPIQPQTQEDNA